MIRRTRRTTSSDNIEAGQDSFLDIVSNMVGILIILVVVAGLRAGKSFPLSQADETRVAAAAEYYEQQRTEYEKISFECMELSQRFETLKTQYEIREAEYREAIQHHARLENAIRSYAETLDADSQKHFELKRQMAELDAMLEELNRKKDWLANQKTETTVLENHPTPISRTADAQKEVHFRILGGRIAHVPFQHFFSRLESEVMKRRNELMTTPQVSGTLGPIDDFRMRYTVVRQDIPMNIGGETGVRSMVMLESCQMIPVGSDLSIGETLEDALKSQSAFHSRLMGSPQNEYSVTIWVYPDSFGEFQKIKDTLYRNGYRVAARPLIFGQPISASPLGTKSSNQ